MASAPAFQAGNAGSIPVVRFNDLRQHHFGGAVFLHSNQMMSLETSVFFKRTDYNQSN